MEFVQPTLWQSESGSFRIAVWGSFFFLAAFTACYFLHHHLARQKSKASAFDIVTVSATAGMIGSKLHSLIETGLIFAPNGLWSAITSSGMNYQGGMILATLAGCFTVFVAGEPVPKITDLAVVTVFISHGIGKLGCFFSGDGCYGKPTDLPWGMSFPNGRIPTTEFVHPVPLYELILSWSAAYLLYRRTEKWISNPDSHRPWDNSTLGLAIMGLSRFFIETVRWHPVVFLGLTSFQLVGAGIFVAAILTRLVLSELLWKKPENKKTN